MSSIAALKQQITQIEQSKKAKEQDITKLRQHGALELAAGEPFKAAGDAKAAQHDRQDIDSYNKQIQQLEREITDLEHHVTNIDTKIAARGNQHIADQQRLEQQFKLDIGQLESEKARLIG